MPVYVFQCQDCQEVFEVRASLRKKRQDYNHSARNARACRRYR